MSEPTRSLSAEPPTASADPNLTAEAENTRTAADADSTKPEFAPGQPAGGSDALAGRYVLGVEIAHGGMGSVYRATDTALNREVAVKLMQPKYRGNPTAVRRFLAEAEITGQLQHPGIPPVYDVGTLPDGSPFLAMKLIKGLTLDKVESPNVAAVFEQICHAVGYAHAHGVIHRDLKPANVMVGAFGEVQVMDWGLAKLASRERKRPEEDPSQTVTAIVSSRDDADETQSGSVLGTPAYMPPEQAIGAIDKIDARSDVFGLGAVLCALLTGKPPYIGPSAESTRQLAAQAKLGDAFARLDGCGADPALVALCRLCLSAEPTDRPADGTAVAMSVARLRADADARAQAAMVENVRVQERTAADRKRRGLQRIAAGVVFAVLAVGGGLAAWQAVRATNAEAETAGQLEKTQAAEKAVTEQLTKTQLAEAKAVGERDRALAARERTWEAVEAMTGSVIAGDALLTQKDIPAEQKKFLKDVLPFYAEFAGENPLEEKARKRVARAAFAIGTIQYRLGANEDCLAMFQAARDLYAKLAADFPYVPEYRRDLAKCLGNLGFVLTGNGKRLEAESSYQAGQAIGAKLALDFPAEPQYRSNLATNQLNLGVLQAGLGKSSDAESSYRAGVAIGEKLSSDFPAVPEHRSKLTITYTNLGNVLADLGRRSEAEKSYRAGLKIGEKLAKDVPEVSDYRMNLAGCHINLGNLLAVLGKRSESELSYRAGLAILEKLVGDFPAAPDNRDHLCSAHMNLGNLLLDLRKYSEAESSCRAGLEIAKKLSEDFPAVLGYRSRMAKCYHNLGILLAQIGKSSEAEPSYRASIVIGEKLAADFPAVPGYRSVLATSYTHLGLLLAGLGKGSESESSYRAALAICEKLVAEFPSVPEYRKGLSGSHVYLGSLLADLGRGSEGVSSYRAGVATCEKLVADFPHEPEYRNGLAAIYTNRGKLLTMLGKRQDAESSYRAGLAVYEKLTTDFPDVREYRITLGGSSCNLADWIRNGENAADSIPLYDKTAATLNAVLAKEPRETATRALLCNCHWGRARAYRDLKRYAEAIADCDAALKYDDGLAKEAVTNLRSRCAKRLAESPLREKAPLPRSHQ